MNNLLKDLKAFANDHVNKALHFANCVHFSVLNGLVALKQVCQESQTVLSRAFTWSGVIG